MYRIFTLLILLGFYTVKSQVIPSTRITDWKNPGCRVAMQSTSTKVNILSFGGNGKIMIDNSTALKNAIASLNGKPGTIFFPAGNYLFNSSINLPDSIILKGSSSDSTTLSFSLSTPVNFINIIGKAPNSFIKITNGFNRGNKTITLENAAGFKAGDFAEIRMDPGNYINTSQSPWAANSIGQMVQIKSVKGNEVTLEKPLRLALLPKLNPRIQKIIPRTNVGIESLKIKKLKSSGDEQTSNINFNYAANCWVKSVESEFCDFAHIELNKSQLITISECYIQDAFGFGSGGKAYGIALQMTSGDNLIQDNIFRHLRHSIILQSGANGNVIGYNYSTEPYWEEGFFMPKNSAGDIVLHGNYPFLNLFEGNINQNTVIDNSHGINGPYNTFFRNRSENYGIFMNGSAGDSTNFIAHEITATGVLTGQYLLTGNGNFQYANNHKGTMKPSGISSLKENSFYLDEKIPSFWNGKSIFPSIGSPNLPGFGKNPAFVRYTAGPKNRCPYLATVITNEPKSDATTVNCNISLDISAKRVKCKSGNKFNIYLSAKNGTGTYQYSIDAGKTWSGSKTFKCKPASKYYIQVKDKMDCKSNIVEYEVK